MNITLNSERNAYNAAFYELGLRWCWDEDTWRDLARIGCEESRIKTYLHKHQSHLLTAYDADFLVAAIQEAKARCHATMRECGTQSIDWKAFQSAEVGV